MASTNRQLKKDKFMPDEMDVEIPLTKAEIEEFESNAEKLNIPELPIHLNKSSYMLDRIKKKRPLIYQKRSLTKSIELLL
jgi:hypothetical protein